jgi:hypothetical protein
MHPIRKNLIIKKSQIGGRLFAPDIIKLINLNQGLAIYDFDDQSKKMFNFKENYSLGNGTNTVLYKIQPVSELPHEFNKYSDKLLIRIYDDSAEQINLLMNENYIEHKKRFPKNIIDIYYYGNIQINNDGNTSNVYYSITREYNIIANNFLDRSFDQSLDILKSLLTFLNELYKSNICYRDMKTENIGYDEYNNCVIIDYDSITLLGVKDVYDLCNSENLKFVYGTYVPKYETREIDLISSFATEIRKLDGKSIRKLDGKSVRELCGINKMYTISLSEIIVSLFFKSQLNNGQFYFNDYAHNFDPTHFDINKIKRDIESLEMLEEFDSNLNSMMKHIIKNLVLTNYYTNIYTPQEIINLFTEFDKNSTFLELIPKSPEKIYISNIEYVKIEKFVTDEAKTTYIFYDVQNLTEPLDNVDPNTLYRVYDQK